MVNILPDISLQGRYTPTEVSVLLGVDRSTIYRAMKSGEIQFHCSPSKQRRYVKGREVIKFYNR